MRPFLVLLALPALIPLIQSVFAAWPAGQVPTGFIHYDMPYYVANGRESFDSGFTFAYRNPYGPADGPIIYFQPHILLLGLIQQAGLDPGLTFNLFGLLSLAAAVWVGFLFYRECIGLETAATRIGLVCFAWGGGVLSLASLAFSRFLGRWADHAPFLFDPMDGWWGLNFGRNLSHPTEAYYHAVFLGCMLMLVRKRHAAALGLGFLLSASHPFTGLSIGLILAAFAALETVLRKPLPRYFLPVSVALPLLHAGYYIWFLNRFPDHRSLQAQWLVDWPYAAWTMLPALYLVGLFASVRLTRWKTLKETLSSSMNRLFAVWLVTVLLLTQHDLFMKPIQPLHFARGYDWMAAFFLGAPALLALLDRLLSIRTQALRTAAVAAFLLLFCSDNLLWLYSFSTPVQNHSISFSREQKDVLNWLAGNAGPGTLVVSQDHRIGYMVSTYSRARSWFGHDLNTPGARRRARESTQFFEDWRPRQEWLHPGTVFVAQFPASPAIPTVERYRNRGYVVFELPSAAAVTFSPTEHTADGRRSAL